jgi:hypothetical protein
MRALAEFIMRGRVQAVTVAVVSALLLMLVPIAVPLVWVSGAVIALVTLRLGPSEGSITVALSTVAGGILFTLLTGSMAPVVLMVLVVWLPLWGLAMVLRTTVSMATTLLVIAAVGLLVVLGQYLAFDDPAAWWRDALGVLEGPLREGMELSQAQVTEVLDVLASTMAAAVASSVIMTLTLSLLLARHWQAELYNPGGFRTEFHSLRYGRVVAMVALVLMLVAMTTGIPLVTDMTAVVTFIYAIQGLAVVHGVAALLNAHWGWLGALYAVMTILLPQMLAVLSGLGLVDAWLDIRARLAKRTS